MGDCSISIVPTKSRYPNKEVKAEEVLQWLISLDIVHREASDCTLGDYGYEVSKGARKIVTHPDLLPFRLISNGLAIITERTVFDTGQNEIEQVQCPICKQNIPTEGLNFASEWFEGNDEITCSLCQVKSEINSYKFDPQWGFSDLGFTFWNWPPFTDKFLSEFRDKLRCDLAIVYQRL